MPADQLATAADLASALQSDLDTSTATLVVECATAVVQAIVRQRILQVTETVVLDLDGYDGGVYLPLPERPVSVVTSAAVGATAVTDFTAQLSRGRLWRAYGWRSLLLAYYNQPSTVTINYTHGYAPGSQKLQLARSAVLSLGKGAYTNPGGALMEAIDDYRVQFDSMSAGMEASPFLIAALKRQYSLPPGSVRLAVCGDNTFAYDQRA
jgi:hypothetical protein